MWNMPLPEDLSHIPGLYETEHIPFPEKMMYAHFFLLDCDWYIAEYDKEDLFYGFVILHGDSQKAEWGYISFQELQDIRLSFMEVDFDLHWIPKKAKEIKSIAGCLEYPG